ncbi:MAG: glycosyltransferase family 2 protein, partial [Lautropia sp.]
MVPAHNEQDVIGACLRSVFLASRCTALSEEPVLVFVVLDDCSDETGSIAREHGAVCVPVCARNVGRARALGAEMALEAGARWLAFTDADSEVPPDWLSTQLALGSDAVCGVVDVREWGDYDDSVRRQFHASYFAMDGHVHIHGANLGVSAGAYRSAGGFPPLA